MWVALRLETSPAYEAWYPLGHGGSRVRLRGMNPEMDSNLRLAALKASASTTVPPGWTLSLTGSRIL